MTTPLEARTVPDIVTELPGPKARAHIEFDHAWTSPSLPRAYPIVPVRGLGCAVEDIDGNVFLDFAAGIAVNSTGHSHPDVVAAIQRQAANLLQHFSASDFYLPIYAQAAAELARIAPMRGPARAFIGNSGAEAVEAGLKLARYHTQAARTSIAFLGGFHGRTMGAVSLTASKAKYHAHFGPLLPGVYHVPFGNEGLEELEQPRVQAPDAGRRVRRRHRRADPGRGRLRRPRGRLPAAPARAVRPPRDPADRRRGPVGRGPHRQDVGDPALGRRAGHPAHGEGHRVGDAGRRDDRRGGPDDLGPGRPRQHVRRQPGRAGGAARDRPAARGRPDRQRRDPRPRDPGRAPAAAPAATRRSSRTSAARA